MPNKAFRFLFLFFFFLSIPTLFYFSAYLVFLRFSERGGAGDNMPSVAAIAPYKLELKRLDFLITKTLQPEKPDDPEAVISFTGFTAAQVDQLRERVNALSTCGVSITQSSQSLFRLPDLSSFKSLHGLLVGTGYFIGAVVACSMGVTLPALVLSSASLSLMGLIVFAIYDCFKASEEAEGNENINQIVDLTKRFENLRDAAIMFSFKVMRENVDAVSNRVTGQEKQVQNQAQEIADLKEQLRRSEEERQQTQQALAALFARVETVEKGSSTAEGQPTAAPNPPVKQEDKLIIA